MSFWHTLGLAHVSVCQILGQAFDTFKCVTLTHLFLLCGYIVTVQTPWTTDQGARRRTTATILCCCVVPAHEQQNCHWYYHWSSVSHEWRRAERDIKLLATPTKLVCAFEIRFPRSSKDIHKQHSKWSSKQDSCSCLAEQKKWSSEFYRENLPKIFVHLKFQRAKLLKTERRRSQWIVDMTLNNAWLFEWIKNTIESLRFKYHRHN